MLLVNNCDVNDPTGLCAFLHKSRSVRYGSLSLQFMILYDLLALISPAAVFESILTLPFCLYAHWYRNKQQVPN